MPINALLDERVGENGDGEADRRAFSASGHALDDGPMVFSSITSSLATAMVSTIDRLSGNSSAGTSPQVQISATGTVIRAG